MTADTITPNHDSAAPCDNWGAVAARSGPGSDRELLERICRQLDHLDTMLHDQARTLAELDPLKPLIPRALALLDPMAKIRKGRRNALQVGETAPVPVGPASAHSQAVGT